MSRIYLDASALVKLVLPEAESPDLVAYLAASRSSITTSVVATIEVGRAARLADPGNEAALRATSLTDACELVELDSDLHLSASQLTPPQLRSLDAIHLASALRVRSAIDGFVTYDRRLGEAAQAAGLPVVSP